MCGVMIGTRPVRSKRKDEERDEHDEQGRTAEK